MYYSATCRIKSSNTLIVAESLVVQTNSLVVQTDYFNTTVDFGDVKTAPTECKEKCLLSDDIIFPKPILNLSFPEELINQSPSPRPLVRLMIARKVYQYILCLSNLCEIRSRLC